MSDHVYGSGSWSTQNKNGTTYHRYVVMVNGKRKDFYGKTKADCLRKYKDYMTDYTPDEFKKTTLTVCDVANKAVESRKGQVKQTTHDFYLYGIKHLNKSKLGALQIHSVTFDDVQTYINSMIETASMSTIKRQKNLLSITFGYAEDNGFIERNFMNKVKLPNKANIVKQEKEHVFLTTEERQRLEEESKRLNTAKVHNGKIGQPLYGIGAKAIVFLLHTGLRMGELSALYWEDVDMENGFIHICRNAPTTTKTITTPKKKASNRTVPIDPVANEILTDLSSEKKGKLVFHTGEGKIIDRNDVIRTLKNMIKRAGIDKNPTLHDLRHTYASELIREGVDMKTVSVVLGHADISTTMNIYVHKSDDDLEGLKNILK